MVRNSVAEIVEKHVTFALECIDRMYLNAYGPSFQTGSGFVWFLKTQLGCRVPSTAMIAPQSRAFAGAFERFAREQGVDLVTFTRGERKDDVLRRVGCASTNSSNGSPRRIAIGSRTRGCARRCSSSACTPERSDRHSRWTAYRPHRARATRPTSGWKPRWTPI
jgi:hypothetical protein